MLNLLGHRRARKRTRQDTNIVVYDLPGADRPEAAAIKGHEVAIFRPPVLLDAHGRTLSGISKDLVARYLVHTTAALAEADLGPVTVEWVEQQGRFVNTRFSIAAWGQAVEIVHPAAPVSQKLANAWEIYKGGIALKVRELHKGHQRFDEANKLISQACRRLDQLRDDDVPHFSDAEFLFLQSEFHRAQVMSALVPVGGAPAEEVVGTLASVA